jgi:nitrogen regulatory protein PII
MKSFNVYKDYSFVTAILPRQTAGLVTQEVLQSGAAHVMTMNARGALVQQHWYQSLLPAISPEQEMLHFIVPGEETDRLMEQIAIVGKLQLYGAGAIFATPCEELICSDDYPLWTSGNYTFESVSFDIQFKQDLTALTHITDRGAAEAIARAAIKAGAQGATITYVRGYGLRDRLGLLRVTKQHDKELITVVVDQFDLEAVFQAMSQAGRVDQPGRGFIYQLPACKGLTNLASVFMAKKHSVSIQQMVSAIDSLYGGTQWRANPLLIRDHRAREFVANDRGVSRDLTLLSVVSQRKDADTLLNGLLSHGCSGATVINWRLAESNSPQMQSGLRINRELGCVTVAVPQHQVAPLLSAYQELVTAHEMKSTCCYIQRVPLVKSFRTIS